MSFFERFVKSTVTTLLRSCRGPRLSGTGGGGMLDGTEGETDGDTLLLGDR